MTYEEFRAERTRLISEMFDNVDEYGIYPTSIFFKGLDTIFLEQQQQINELEVANKNLQDNTVSLIAYKKQENKIKELTEGAIKASEIKVADEQQIKDGLAREKELNKMLDKWEEENLISIDEINKMKENSKHIHDGLKATIEDKQQQIKELEEYAQHKRGCKTKTDRDWKAKCTCGFDKLNKH